MTPASNCIVHTVLLSVLDSVLVTLGNVSQYLNISCIGPEDCLGALDTRGWCNCSGECGIGS